MRPVIAVVMVLSGCRVNFDPSTFDTCGIVDEVGVPAFRWDNDHCYSLHTSPVTQAVAGEACGAIGAHPVTYGSQDELDAVLTNLAPSSRTWIGGRMGPGGFAWSTGEPSLFGNWGPGQPDLGVGGEIAMNPDGTWLTVSTIQAFICERSVVVTSDRVYTHETALETWDLALEYCEQRGAHLATIESFAESMTIKTLVGTPRWLGGSSAAGTTDFTWVTGEPFDYQDWQNTQPDGLTENCLEVDDGGWNNNDCGTQLASICEYE